MLSELREELNNKVNVDDFDALRDMVASMGSAGGVPPPAPSMSTKDLNLLRDLSKKVEDMTQTIADHSKINESLNSRVSSLEQTMPQKANISDLDSLRQSQAPSAAPVSAKSEPDNAKLAALARRVGILEEHLLKFGIPEGFDFNALLRDISNLQSNFKESKETNENLFKDIFQKLKDLESSLKSKISSEDLLAFESKIQEKVISICGAMGKKFADKI